MKFGLRRFAERVMPNFRGAFGSHADRVVAHGVLSWV
jgi:hypothetical protein